MDSQNEKFPWPALLAVCVAALSVTAGVDTYLHRDGGAGKHGATAPQPVYELVGGLYRDLPKEAKFPGPWFMGMPAFGGGCSEVETTPEIFVHDLRDGGATVSAYWSPKRYDQVFFVEVDGSTAALFSREYTACEGTMRGMRVRAQRRSRGLE